VGELAGEASVEGEAGAEQGADPGRDQEHGHQVGIDGIRMLKRLAERDIRHSSSAGDVTALTEQALRILYQRKAFREETGMDEEHFPEGKPPPPPPHGGPPHGPEGRPRPGTPKPR
jgi:hypothetical protein